jgi:hypothetical protein
MPRYARHDRMKGQDRVWGFLASLETTEKGCHPEPFFCRLEPFLSPRAPFFVAPSLFYVPPSEARGLPVGRRPERRGGSLGAYAPREDKKGVRLGKTKKGKRDEA